jgi:outer membrane cobalamin receptor
VAYSDANLFRLGMRANYNYRNTLNVQAKMAFNGWNVELENYAWLKPAFEADISADWRFNRSLSFSSSLFIQGVTYAKLGDTAYRMRPAVDMNMAASYSFSRAFSMFARLNNVLNSRYEHFYGYKVQGINLMLGGSLSF